MTNFSSFHFFSVVLRFKKMKFFEVAPPKKVFEVINSFSPVSEELIHIDDALGRVISEDVFSPCDLPGFFRASMDGYAVRARDTFGASQSLPAILRIKGEVKMGEIPKVKVGEGEAVKISTGGMLPEGADGVVMIEYCHRIDEETIEVERAISPFENVIAPDDDVKKGELVLKKGKRLRPQDIGILAGLGIASVKVYRKPKVAIISTGDEIVPIEKEPPPGKVRDINRYTLSAFCRSLFAEPVFLGICPDDFSRLKDLVEEGLRIADTVWISGGSSVGTRDLTLKVFESISDFRLLVHGIAISPGKPTIIGTVKEKPVVGIPGHVASALIVAEVFMSRLLRRLSGEDPFQDPPKIEARMTRNIESAPGREDYIRVKLVEKDKQLYAEPIIGKSGLISTLVEADGLVRVDMNKEGVYEGEKVEVIPFVSKGLW